jgi:UDP-GlcNAc:undecaprenyl-phosphate/decaprenyl-phosphate GlcNAc-1-phosphate transferase
VWLYFLLCIAAGLATIGCVPIVKRVARVIGALDEPTEERQIHAASVPRLGGVAVFVPAFATALLGLYLLSEAGTLESAPALVGLFVASSAVFILGICDDVFKLRPSVKLAVQGAATAVLYFSGIRIEEITTPFGVWHLPAVVGILLMGFWVVGLTNGMNLVDGVDGLAAGLGIIGAITIVVIAFSQDSLDVALIAGTLCGSLAGFLLFNFHPATIFLGDSGALTLGFLLAAVPILASQKSTAAFALLVPMIAFGVPIFDTILAIVRRTAQGKGLFQADREHVHHRLLSLGLNQRQVALTLYAVSAVLAVMAILMTTASRAGALAILGALGAGLIVCMRRLGMDAIQGVWRKLRHGERRQRPPWFRSLLAQNSASSLERCRSAQEMARVLDDVRRGLEYDTLQVRFRDDLLRLFPQGVGTLILADSAPSVPTPREAGETLAAQAPAYAEPMWMGTAQILCGVSRGGRNNGHHDCQSNGRCDFADALSSNGDGCVVGEIVATKPSWKRRRASETDDEFVTLLARGLGRWFAGRLGNASRLPD